MLVNGVVRVRKSQQPVRERTQFRILRDKLFRYVVFLLSFLILTPLIVILYHISLKGLKVVSWDFLFSLPKPAGEQGGGIYNSIVGSIYLVSLGFIFSVPLGVAVGIYVSERKETLLANLTGQLSSVMQGVPSIVVGIIVYCWLVLPFRTFSALAGGVALAIMMVPLVIKATEETLNALPSSLREASYALGVSYSRTVLKVLVPSALNGIITGILVSVTRVFGETAPLLFTSFGSQYLSYSILKPIDAIPLRVYTYAMSPYPEWHDLAWGASFVLATIVVTLNILTKVIQRRWKVRF